MIVVKLEDTSRANDATPTDDPDLTLNIPATGTYRIRALLRPYTTSNTPQIKWGFSAPAFSFARRLTIGGRDDDFDVGSVKTDLVTPEAMDLSENTAYQYIIDVLATFTGTGTFALQWSQNNSNATATTLRAGSWMQADAI